MGPRPAGARVGGAICCVAAPHGARRLRMDRGATKRHEKRACSGARAEEPHDLESHCVRRPGFSLEKNGFTRVNSHSLSFSDLRRGTSASPLPSRTSRRRSQALKGHARGTRGRHTMRLSHRAFHARPPSTPVNPPARQGARCLSAPAFLSGSRGLQLRRPQACSVPSRRTAYTAMGHARPVGLGIPSKRLRVRRS